MTLQIEKILESDPGIGTKAMQVYIPREVRRFAKIKQASQPVDEPTLLIGEIYLDILLRGIAKVRKNPLTFTAKRQSSKEFKKDKFYTLMYVPNHVNTQVDEIRAKYGGTSKHGQAGYNKMEGKTPKQQIFAHLLSIGFANLAEKA